MTIHIPYSEPRRQEEVKTACMHIKLHTWELNSALHTSSNHVDCGLGVLGS